ncbi:MAG: helix-turn-helix domain-containing protein [Phycisphaeraceae bacterium JB051]
MRKKPSNSTGQANVHLQILDPQESDNLPQQTMGTLGSLQELMQTISLVTGLDVCIYPPPRKTADSNIRHLPVSYLRHRSKFCLAAKRTRDGRGCRGHDSSLTNTRAGHIGKPFVQTCHRGVAEVIVPICHGSEHLATVFIGQVITPEIETRGFEAIWLDAKDQVTSRKQLQLGFEALPRMTEEQLLRVGMLADAALRGLADQLSTDAFIAQVKLQSSPAIRHAVDILHLEHCWDISASAMSERVHLSAAHFSRLFHRVMGITFSSYLNQHRLTAAQNLLHHSTMSIAQIAQHCGFSRQSYFTRRFHDAFGMTPSTFRSSMKTQSR